jgi:Plasmid recombination enzyme
MSYAILRTEKLKGSAVSSSDMHLDRKRETLNADKARTDKNIYLIGEKGESLRELVNYHIGEAGGKPRRDSVECVEFLMTASPDYFSSPTKTFDFVRQSKKFMDRLESRGMKFVKAVVHLDELTPHISAFAVPFDDKGKLNAKAHLGGREKLSKLQDEYAEVMKPLGLERGIKGSVAEHQTIQKYYGKLDMLDQSQEQIQQLQMNQDRSREMLQRTTDLLNNELEKKTDIPLIEAAKLIDVDTIEFPEGLALVDKKKRGLLIGLITPDNKAFGADGIKISDGSSVMMLTQIASVTPEKAVEIIRENYDDETAARSGRAYGEELAKKGSTDYDEKKEMENVKAKVREENETEESEAIEVEQIEETEALVLA